MVKDKLYPFFTSQNEFNVPEEETSEDEETKGGSEEGGPEKEEGLGEETEEAPE